MGEPSFLVLGELGKLRELREMGKIGRWRGNLFPHFSWVRPVDWVSLA